MLQSGGRMIHEAESFRTPADSNSDQAEQELALQKLTLGSSHVSSAVASSYLRCLVDGA